MNINVSLEKLANSPIKDLNLLGNQLTQFPTAIKNFTTLDTLNINSNQFHDLHQLLQDLSVLPLKKLDIRFMGTEAIALENAQTIIPTLQEISCDIRTTAQYESDVSGWVTKSLQLS